MKSGKQEISNLPANDVTNLGRLRSSCSGRRSGVAATSESNFRTLEHIRQYHMRGNYTSSHLSFPFLGFDF